MSNKKYNNYINGVWRESSEYRVNQSPADLDDVIGEFAIATADDANDAIAAAKAAAPAWQYSGLEQRKAALDFIGNELIERKDEIGRLLCREEGKTLAEGVGEVARAGQFFQYYAAECLRQIGDLAQSTRPGIDVEVSREPVGVVGIITPWNFPIAVAAWKVAPALAFGNTVVLKPAELTPASAWALADIISRSGLPDGVFNLVIGSGSVVGNAICASKDVDAVTFTGSGAVGQRIAQQVVGNMGKIQLEMGSKNSLLVAADADIEVAVQCALNGAFFGSGQKCTASSRLIVDASVHDEFVERMVAGAKKLVVGHPFSDGVHIGSMASKDQFDTVLNYIDIAKAAGAELLCGGQALDLSPKGYYIEPTLFANTSNDMQVNREEMFGPVTCVIKADSYEQGLSIANDTDYGLTSGIITQSLKTANHFKKHATAGCVMVNLPTAGTDYHVPFGGRRASSYGSREQGQYAQEFYTVVKTVYQSA